MTQIEYDENGAPKLLRVVQRLEILERMRDHRQECLADVSTPTHQGKIGPGTAKHFEKELVALEAAIAALRYHRAAMEGMPEFISALRFIVESQNDPGALQVAVKRAGLLLQEHDAIEAIRRAG